MEQIYVLKCAKGKIYVGKTWNVAKRLHEHQHGSGSEWTRKYLPSKILEVHTMTSAHDENNTVKDWMLKVGIQNVRGGSYSEPILSAETIRSLEKELLGATDKCFKCGLGGHFAKDCFIEADSESEDEDICYRCGRGGHYLSECYASRHANGRILY
jgi:predicted GIY-YIG superfamily endonuclease